ncbi:MAG: DUF1549 and DUF1553 domain-containing protein, partial [Planctomycetia bacterium]|nr:DUF1549 and DUF1553 domain-containing protein [Planctomycetia bacterium]
MRLLSRLSVVVLSLCVANALPAADPLPEDWAFRAYKRPAVPEIPNAKPQVKNPIDKFLIAKLSDKGLSFAPEADRRTLIRRMYFDLIGLPPTPEQVEAFVNDKSPDAYEKVVDQLLASPQYGERMALYWLDLVRFAETDGFKADDIRPLAWRYRDYVIRSFNADKPYDRFVKEQLAGDELYPDDTDALIATGFLRHFPDEYNAVNLEQRRYEILTDITDTTSATFLGLTMGCARCHDHKYDPVMQSDYFRMQAFFAGFWPVEVPLLKPSERVEWEKKRTEWESKTADVRSAIAKLEEPHRKKESNRQRGRFPEEYAKLLDVPFAKRTSFEKQIAVMVERQVYDTNKDVSKSIKGAEKKEYDGLKAKLAELSKGKPADPPPVMAMTDLPDPPTTHLYKRGDWRKPGEELVPGFIAKIDDRDADVKPMGGSSGRRAALANWIASKENPLTARVIVNRLWQQHFGKGLVGTASDFGVAGDRPTHPELLDWLATELVNPDRKGGGEAKPWSLKHIHRFIVTSTAYKQSTKGAEAGAKADPENTLLWQYPRRRLDGEALRDAMLAVSGQLNLKAGGP